MLLFLDGLQDFVFKKGFHVFQSEDDLPGAELQVWPWLWLR